MRVLCPLIFSIFLLMPPQSMAQSGSVGSSGSGSAGVTSGTGTGSTTGTGTGGTTAAPSSTMPGPPGVNSAGTAQSSGPGVTTGSASSSKDEDEKMRAEDARIDKKLKSICKGC